MHKTPQESFWAGSFGTDYIARNNSHQLLDAKLALWSRMLRAAHQISSVIELGCNIGLNLLALHRLKPSLQLVGYEINSDAVRQARNLNIAEVHQKTIIEPLSATPADLCFTAGVLIHIDPKHLSNAYENLVTSAARYVLVAEYYNPSPVSLDYRGHRDRLFKRDFAGDLIDTYGLKLIDYGFAYKRDNWVPQDDITWFLLAK